MARWRATACRATRVIESQKKDRSEEHTSELQSLAYLVCRLLLEKKKQKRYNRRPLAPSPAAPPVQLDHPRATRPTEPGSPARPGPHQQKRRGIHVSAFAQVSVR